MLVPSRGLPVLAQINMKVLIADDDIVTRTMLRSMLLKRGHEVIEKEDGLSAWEYLLAAQRSSNEDRVQFVVSDWMMPRLDGPSLIARIRQANFRRYTYIVMLTSRNAVEDTVAGLEAGADDYLTKPFDLNEFRARVAIGERIVSLETRLREANNKLKEMATRDSLTGLLNRRALYDLGSRELSRARRRKSPLSAIMIDLDHFKRINDQHGHLVGDQALRQTADILQVGLREYDLLGRWGGEEFLMILPSTDTPEAIVVAERLRSEISRLPITTPDGRVIPIRASFGVARLSQYAADARFDDLVRDADIALYQAKHSGRDQVSLFAGALSSRLA